MSTEDWALVIACLSLAASLFTYAISYFQNRRLSRSGLEAEYFHKIFDDFLLMKIPQAARRLSYQKNGRLGKEYQLLDEILLDMVDAASYFAYARNDFYEDIRNMVFAFDENLVQLGSVVIQEEKEQKEKLYEINLRLEELVQRIKREYYA